MRNELNADCLHLLRYVQLRWMELSAFSDSLFRSHLGTYPDNSTQFYSDNETFAAFATFAHVHAALGPYRLQLMQVAAGSGMPITRHMWLQFPDDPVTFNLTEQVRFAITSSSSLLQP